MSIFCDQLKIALEAAKAAGAVQVKYFGNEFSIAEKKASYDRVTSADLESEEIIVNILCKSYPDYNIVAEENDYPRTNSDYTWIIDPLDGTNNFSCGIPIFASSIALVKGNDVLCGVVYNPIDKTLFYAQKGKGAFLNDKKIQVNDANNLKEALLITGFYYDRGQDMQNNLRTVERFFKSDIIGLRRLGAAALDLCYVASGRAAGFWEFCLRSWDFAAGRIILEEAGGRITNNVGDDVLVNDKSFIVASNSKIHDHMLQIIQNKQL